MAALRVEINPDSKPEVSRLAHRQLYASVHTWKTFINVTMEADGTALVTVTRDGETVHSFSLLPE